MGSEFRANHAQLAGGALFEGETVVEGTRFTENVAQNEGGAAAFTKISDISDTIFERNSAEMGGASVVAFTSAHFTATVFSENLSVSGGAIYFSFLQPGSSVTASRFEGNRASDTGGAIYMSAGELSLDRNLFRNNAADKDGGALHVASNGGLVKLINNAFMNNSGGASFAADIGLDDVVQSNVLAQHNTHVTNDQNQIAMNSGIESGNVLTVENSILSGYGTGFVAQQGSTIIADRILFEAVLTPTWVISPTSFVTLTHALSGSAGFADAANGNLHLTLASAAIDQGVSSEVIEDVDAQSRPFGNAPDLGFDESDITATLRASNSGPSIVGEQIDLTATLNIGGNYRFAWEFGDGAFASDQAAEVHHAFANAGSYTVVVTASNGIRESAGTTQVEIVAGPTPTPTATDTPAPTATPTSTSTPIATQTATPTGTLTPIATQTATPTGTATPIATQSPTPTITPTPIATQTTVPTDTATQTPTPTGTRQPTETATATPTPTPAPTQSQSQPNSQYAYLPVLS